MTFKVLSSAFCNPAHYGVVRGRTSLLPGALQLGIFSMLDSSSVPLEDFSSLASSYFTSVRVPAALIAGSSLAALFSMVDEARGIQKKRTRRLPRTILLIYHILALISMLLGLNVVVTATATANNILLGCPNPYATSPFDLLNREFPYEFHFTRWSFFVSLLSFVACVMCRTLLEFNLLARTRAAVMVSSCFGTLFFHLLAFVNSRLMSYQNLAHMTLGVFRMWFMRSVRGTSPSELISLGCFGVAVVTAGTMLYQSVTLPNTLAKNNISDANGVVQDDEEEEQEQEEEDATMIATRTIAETSGSIATSTPPAGTDRH